MVAAGAAGRDKNRVRATESMTVTGASGRAGASAGIELGPKHAKPTTTLQTLHTSLSSPTRTPAASEGKGRCGEWVAMKAGAGVPIQQRAGTFVSTMAGWSTATGNRQWTVQVMGARWVRLMVRGLELGSEHLSQMRARVSCN